MLSERSSEFLCNSYVCVSPSSSNSYGLRPIHSKREESPCSISLCLSDSHWLACSSRTSGWATGCKTCAVETNGPPASIHTGFLYRGRFPFVEFLWRSGPVSRRHETVPSPLSARERSRRAPRCSSPTPARNGRSGDLRLPAARRSPGPAARRRRAAAPARRIAAPVDQTGRPLPNEVRADGERLTCEPARVLPMAQRYFLF